MQIKFVVAGTNSKKSKYDRQALLDAIHYKDTPFEVVEITLKPFEDGGKKAVAVLANGYQIGVAPRRVTKRLLANLSRMTGTPEIAVFEGEGNVLCAEVAAQFDASELPKSLDFWFPRLLGIATALLICLACGRMIFGNDERPAPTPTPPATSRVSVQPSVPSSAITPRPTFTPKYTIDWDVCINQTLTDIENPAYYPYVYDAHIEISDDIILFTAVVADNTDKSTAAELADSMLRAFGMYASFQNSSIKSPGKDTYGGVFDTYNAIVSVAELSKVDAGTSEWLIDQSILKGTHRQIKGLKRMY